MWLLLLALAACALPSPAQPSASQASEQAAQSLADAGDWQRVVDLLGPKSARNADECFLYGSALARLNRWDDAAAAFSAGEKLAPADVRFPEELGGVAFHQKRYADAARQMQRALQLKPQDTYASDLLATVYYIEGNLPAALKYWNRNGKPRIEFLRQDPPLRVNAALLDRAFAFAPHSVLREQEFLNTRVRLEGLGILPQFQIDLSALNNEAFDAVLRAQELNGLGMSRWQVATNLLLGLPFQSVHLDAFNLRRQAINLRTMYRWDAQKRRVLASLSMPFESRAPYRGEAALDLRDENWVVRASFTGAAPSLGSVKLRREALQLALAGHASERLEWNAGAEISHRDFRSVIDGPALTPDLLAKGFALKQDAEIRSVLWRLPERRFVVDASASSQAGRLWSVETESFEKLAGSLRWHWLPRAQGIDYAMEHTLRAGKTFGAIPFDELTMLGLERDNDLPLRAHIGTRDGKKGSAPLGRDFVLSNWELDKNVYSNGLVTVQAGPFVDAGALSDPNAALGSHQWLWDVGAQAKLRVFGKGIALSYGRDLRSGNNAVYVTLLASPHRDE